MVRIISNEHKLIITIVKKNLARRVLKACRKAGAEGGTIFPGRGTGTHETGSILGVKVEPEKEIILCLVPQKIVDKTISKIRAAARLDRPGTGIAFVIKSNKISGIAHMLSAQTSSSPKS
ncbi:MAG: P-II family nitrogen regulator [Gracilimonas sp.]